VMGLSLEQIVPQRCHLLNFEQLNNQQKKSRLLVHNHCCRNWQIGLGQRFCNFVDKAYREQLFVKNKNPVEIVTQLTKRTLDDFISTHVSAGVTER